MLKLKCQHFGHLMLRADSFEKTSMLEKVEGRRRRGWQRMRGWMASPTQWTWVWVNSGSWWWTGRPGVLQFMESQSQTLLKDWTELKVRMIGISYHPVYYREKEQAKKWDRILNHSVVISEIKRSNNRHTIAGFIVSYTIIFRQFIFLRKICFQELTELTQ